MRTLLDNHPGLPLAWTGHFGATSDILRPTGTGLGKHSTPLCEGEAPLLPPGHKPVPGLRAWQASHELDISPHLLVGQLPCAVYKLHNCPGTCR